ncbi:hypothetical protein IL306_012909 [Fusarium sp. DS 682]|nr:hypothetical protein IL306_012909 [Fusarium sp. DS 682]
MWRPGHHVMNYVGWTDSGRDVINSDNYGVSGYSTNSMYQIYKLACDDDEGIYPALEFRFDEAHHPLNGLATLISRVEGATVNIYTIGEVSGRPGNGTGITTTTDSQYWVDGITFTQASFNILPVRAEDLGGNDVPAFVLMVANAPTYQPAETWSWNPGSASPLHYWFCVMMDWFSRTGLIGTGILLALQSIILVVELASFPWHKVSLSNITHLLRRKADTHEGDQATDDGQENEDQQKDEAAQSAIDAFKAAKRSKTSGGWISHVRQLAAPIFICVIGISFAIASLANKYGSQRAAIPFASNSRETVCDNVSSAAVDADIGGDGIRIAVWAQSVALIIITLLGTFQCNALGAKEIGAGLAITHVSLAIALIVQMERKTLTSADAIVGAMLLDSQASALSVQLMAKEVLAARWQVGIIIGCQTIGMVLLPIIVARFDAGVFIDQDSCFCITAFWWGWMTDCPETNKNHEAAAFWVYLSCRMLGFIQSAFFAIANTNQFHRAEKWNDSLKDISFPELSARPDDRETDTTNEPEVYGEATTPLYENYPATVTLMYLIHAVFSLTSMTAAHKIMQSGLKPSSDAVSVGQMIAIVVAGATILRAIWLLWRTLSPKRGKYVWPFQLDIASKIWRVSWDLWDDSSAMPRNTFMLAVNPDFPSYREDETAPYRLGAIFSDPKNLRTKLCQADLPEKIFSSTVTNLTYEYFSHKVSKLELFCCRNERVQRDEASFSVDRLETHWVEFGLERLSAIFELPEVKRMVRSRLTGARIYIITGLKIAAGLKVRRDGGWMPFDGKRVFAYQLKEVQIQDRGPRIVRVVQNAGNPALF